MMFGSTVTSTLSPAAASQYTGRYETVVKSKDGRPMKVLRSIRHAPVKQLLLQGHITPTKKAPVLPENAIENLCGLFEKKVKVTPRKHLDRSLLAGQKKTIVEEKDIAKLPAKVNDDVEQLSTILEEGIVAGKIENEKVAQGDVQDENAVFNAQIDTTKKAFNLQKDNLEKLNVASPSTRRSRRISTRAPTQLK